VTVVRVSPTQADDFAHPETGCQRRWGYKRLDGLPDPPGPYQQFGTEGHSVLDSWLRDGKVPDLSTKHGQAVVPGLKFLPAPSPDLRVEHEFAFHFDRIEYNGKVDLHYLSVAPEDGATEIIVTDHKFTGDFHWIKTPEKLQGDTQRIIYNAWATLQYGVEWVRSRWVYYKRTPPYGAKVSELRQHRTEIWNAFSQVHDIALRIRTARGKKSTDLPQNFAACRAFGRVCPFMERCHGTRDVDPMAIMDAIFSQVERKEQNMGVLDMLGINPNGQPAPAAVAIPPVAYQSPPQAAPAPAPPVAYQPPPQAAPAAAPVAYQPPSQAAPAPPALAPAPLSQTLLSIATGEKPKRARNKAEDLTFPNCVRAVFQIAALMSGRTPDQADTHFKAWQAGG
jgi:hypothetical protein